MTHLQPHQQRVLEEREQLDERIEKLSNFIVSAAFYKLDLEDQLLLRRQFVHMNAYLATLDERITRFPPAPAAEEGATDQAGETSL